MRNIIVYYSGDRHEPCVVFYSTSTVLEENTSANIPTVFGLRAIIYKIKTKTIIYKD